MKKHTFLCAASLCLAFSTVKAQVGTEFWFAAPEVSAVTTTYDGLPADRPIKLHFGSKSVSSTVVISQPSGSMPPQTLVVPANGMASIDLTTWINLIESKPANTVLNTGLKITASSPVSAYYSDEDVPNAEPFMLKGRPAMGTSFWIPSQNIGSNGSYNPPASSSFDIVASQNGTSVTITPSNPIVGHAANVPFTVVLNAGQTYSATALGVAANQHLGGSRITSNLPIAITIKDDLLSCPDIGSAFELIGDQIIPTTKLGTEFVAVKGNLTGASDRVFITATANGTTISSNGGVVTTINQGQTYALPFTTDVATIQTTQYAYVYQLSGVGAETGAKLIAPLKSQNCDKTFYQRLMSDKFIVTLVVPTSATGNFLVNGVSGVVTSAQFAPIPVYPSYSYAKIDLSGSTFYPAGAVFTVENTAARFQQGILDGFVGWGANFAYFADYFADNGILRGTAETDQTSNFKLYPNPARDMATVEGSDIISVKVFNVMGQEVKAPVTANGNAYNISVSGLAPGNYFVQVNDASGNSKMLKLVKDK